MLQAVTDRVREGFRTEACQIYLRAEDDVHRVVLQAASGMPESLVGKLTYRVGQGLTGHIIQRGTAIQIRETGQASEWQDPHLAEITPHLPSGAYRSFVGVPLRLGDEILGTLQLVNKIPSSPGHRDWFTDDDEGYLRLLSTAIGGVIEGARYLKALNDVGVTAMRMQRVASFGTLAQRIRHEASNPLAVARLAATNLRSDLQDALDSAGEERVSQVNRRLDVIEDSLDAVSAKLLELLKFSQHIGFVRTTTDWNNVIREALIWLAAERQRRRVEMQVLQEDLPPLFIEPNELFGVVVTILRVAMEGLGPAGGLIEVRTLTCDRSGCFQTRVRVPDATMQEKVIGIVEPATGAPEELSPLHFEWGLAQETIEMQYDGALQVRAREGGLEFLLELPFEMGR
jgi:signal transduction histidine kinase